MLTLNTLRAHNRPLRVSAALTALLAAIMLSACGVSVKSMTPDLSARGYTPSRLTLRVQPVADSKDYWRVGAPVSGKELRETVVQALRKANLFSAVITDGDADLVLYVHHEQQQNEPGGRAIGNWELRREVIVTYELVDTASRKNVWKDTIRTVAGSTAIGGGPATKEASEGAVRENVKALAIAAAEQWPRNTR